MPQDRTSGAKAAEWGHATAQKIAAHIGARGIGRLSNECDLNGERIVIKCARVATQSVGVTYQMLERIDRVVAAFELDDGSFELWSITPEQFRGSMRESRSRGGIGKTALVERKFFQQNGLKMARVHVNRS
jgi:hypothetical protein